MVESVEDVRKWLEKWPQIQNQVNNFILRLKRRQLYGSKSVIETMQLLRNIIGTCKWGDAQQLLRIMKVLGKQFTDANPQEFAIGNVVRRVLAIIREEYISKLLKESVDGQRAHMFHQSNMITNFSAPVPELKDSILDAMTEMFTETETVYESICAQALDHIHFNEVILTFGKSHTVKLFLQTAAKKRKFHVIVAETAPNYYGQEMAKMLAELNIETTVINDSAIFAVMARVNKVLLPTRAVLANGGLITEAGGHLIALAAKELSIPVVSVIALYKVTPLFPHDVDDFTMLLSPQNLIEYPESTAMEQVDIVNPSHDYIPPELVDLYITNTGGHQPSYIYRLLADYYHPSDHQLSDTI